MLTTLLSHNIQSTSNMGTQSPGALLLEVCAVWDPHHDAGATAHSNPRGPKHPKIIRLRVFCMKKSQQRFLRCALRLCAGKGKNRKSGAHKRWDPVRRFGIFSQLKF